MELKSRYHVRLEKYIKEVDIEAVTLYNMVQNQIIPAAVNYQKNIATSVKSVMDILGDGKELKSQKNLVKIVSALISDTQNLVDELNVKVDKANTIESEEKKAAYICDEIKKTMADIRDKVDTLEALCG